MGSGRILLAWRHNRLRALRFGESRRSFAEAEGPPYDRRRAVPAPVDERAPVRQDWRGYYRGGRVSSAGRDHEKAVFVCDLDSDCGARCGAFGMLALSRGETISAGWLVVAGVCTYLVAYRFYSRYLAYTVFGLDDRRATPAERLNNGRDFCPTNKWVAAGHHFSAISGAGPLVGPTLAAQFGFLPGTIWLIAGVVLGGAVQDMIVLCASVRRDGKSLGQMAKEEVNPVAGMAAMVAVFAIMIILLAVLALVVVNALRDSPWGLFTIAATIPIALLMGAWMNNIRPGKVAEATGIGIVLLMAALLGGQWVAAHPTWSAAFTWSGTDLAWAVIVHGFVASVLPVWLLLAPRDYLSAFLKIGTILVLGTAIVVLMPPMKLPAVTQFIDGTGPVFAGKLFPFAFITIACGAVSGFHALISSGTTPKLVKRESDIRVIGYGSMLMDRW